MARQVPFGDILRDAREREGLDLNTAARKLHIRPDILRAIEDSDFARMPPRGYTRNMVNAYARLVGLNASQMSALYADQAYAHEVGRSRSDDMRTDGRSRGAGQSRGSSRSSRGASSRPQSSYNGRSAAGRGIYDDRTDLQGRAYSTRFSSGSQQARGGTYRNVYAGSGPAPVASKLPFVLIGIIVLLILIIVLVLLFGNKGSDQSDVPADMPIAGLTNTANPSEGQGNAADAAAAAAAAATPKVEEPPTKAVFSFEVPEGESAYIEVKLGDTTSYDVASIVDGPKEKSYDVTDTLTFATTSPDSVVLTLDGETVKPTEIRNQPGVYSYTVNFADILEQWKADHPDAADSSKSDGDSASSSADSAGSGSGGSDSSSSSGTSNTDSGSTQQ